VADQPHAVKSRLDDVDASAVWHMGHTR
jgi:hypothetical protein